MAQFSLSMKNQRGITTLTDYDTLNNRTAGLTFDERLNLNVDGSTLDFSMLKYLYEASNKVVNIAAISITYGTVIQLLINNYRYDFAVTDIDYQFMPENVQLSFSAQDLFQFETARLGVGYTIVADTTDPEYLGAQPIDYWAQKIITDTNLHWSYIPIDQLNNEILVNYTSSHINKVRTDIEQNITTWLDLPKTDYSTFNNQVSFECNNSNAYNALKQLANENELFIWVDYTNRNFGFIPLKNPVFNGYYFNPNNNLQQFSLRGSGGNLVTVLNVTGPKDINNQEITLVPNIPLDVATYINTDEWLNSKYHSELYNDITDDQEFKEQINYTPWLENKLIDISFFVDSHILTTYEQTDIEYTLTNDLRIANGLMLTSWRSYLEQYEKDLMRLNQNEINLEAVMAELYSDNNRLLSLVDTKQYTPIWLAYLDSTTNQKYLTASVPSNYHIDIVTPERTYPNVFDNLSIISSDYFAINKPNISVTDIIWPTRVSGRYEYTISMPGNGGTARSNRIIDAEIVANKFLRFGHVLNTTTKLGQPVSYWGLDFDVSAINDKFPFGRRHKNELWKVTIGRPIVGLGFSQGYVGFRLNSDEVTAGTYNNYRVRFSNINYLLYLKSDNYYWDASPTSSTQLIDISDLNAEQNYDTKFTVLATYVDPYEGGSQSVTLTGNISLIIYKIRFTNIISSITIEWGGWDTYELPFTPPHIMLDCFYVCPTKLNQNVTVYADDNHQASIKYNATKFQITNNYYGTLLQYNSTLILYNQAQTISPVNDPICGWLLNTGASLDNSLILKQGPITIKPYTTWTSVGDDGAVIKHKDYEPDIIIEDLDKVSALQSIYTVQTWSPDLFKINTAGLVDHFNKYSARYQNAYDLLLENLYKFNTYWCKEVSTQTSVSIGQFYATYRKIGIVVNDTVLTNGSRWNSTDSSLIINNNDLTILRQALLIQNDNDILRSNVIQFCASIASTLTSYWQIIYSCATQLGYYVPQNWDCLDIIEDEKYWNHQRIYNLLLALIPVSNTSYTNPRWTNAPILNTWILPTLTQNEASYQHNYKFYDDNNIVAIDTLPISQTENYYIKETNIDSNIYPYYALIQSNHDNTDAINLYYSTNRIKEITYSLGEKHFNALVQNILQFTSVPITVQNPVEKFLKLLAGSSQYDLTKYYQSLNQHNLIWQNLYHKYPGIFRESEYVNENAQNSHELYLTAKQQLQQLSRPEFSYNLTGMDIYMHNSDFLPTRIKLGEQIRIDYQDKDQITDTLNAALREPLFITGINHTLRNDGDYQFTVTTRSATDTMVQRFAKLLNFGK